MFFSVFDIFDRGTDMTWKIKNNNTGFIMEDY